MSEKRFYRASVCGDEGLYDKKNGCIISNVRSNIDIEENWNTVIDLLNEQQNKIDELNQIIKRQKEVIDIYLNELVEAGNQGYCLSITHRNEHCRIMPGEIDK